MNLEINKIEAQYLISVLNNKACSINDLIRDETDLKGHKFEYLSSERQMIKNILLKILNRKW